MTDATPAPPDSPHDSAPDSASDSPPGPDRISPLEFIGLLAFGSLVFFFAFRPAFAVDLFWLLELGEQIVASGRIVDRDLFSAVHPDAPWVHFQWGWEVLAFLAVDSLGLTALRAGNAFVVALAMVGLYWVLRTRLGRGAAACLTAAALVLFEDRIRLRPDVFNFALWIPLVAWTLDLAQPPRRCARLRLAGVDVGAFALALIWSNLHAGGVLIALTMLGAAAAGTWLADRPHTGPWWRLLLSAALGAAINPAFLPGLTHFASIFDTVISSGNEEWLPSYTILRYGWHPNFVVVALGPALAALGWAASVRARRRRGEPVPVAEIALALVCIAMSNAFVRGAYLALLPAAFAWAPLRRAWAGPAASRLRWLPAALAVALLAVAVHYNVYRARGSWARAAEMATFDLEPTAFPELAGRFLNEAEIEGGILNEGRWAGYLIWSCYPRCRVFVDSRHHVTEEMWHAFRAMHDPMARAASLSAAADRWNLSLAVFAAPTFPLHFAPEDWELIYKAGAEEVHLRRGSELAESNRRRAVQWLAAHGARFSGPHPTSDELRHAATTIGAQQWLGSDWMQLRMAEWQDKLASGDEDDQIRARRGISHAFFDAGLYEAALESYAALPATARTASDDLRRALALFLTQEWSQAARVAKEIDGQALPPLERSRLRMLLGTLQQAGGQ